MRVLVQGAGRPLVVSRNISCSRCSALIEYNEDEYDMKWKGDFRSRHRHDVDGDLVAEWYEIQCPECNWQITVPTPSDHIVRILRPSDL